MKNLEAKKKKITGVVDAASMLSSTSGDRRKVEITSHVWKCEYCSQEFKYESGYMKHECPQMVRAQEIKTMDGQAAYQYYCDWFRTLKRKAPPIDTFIHSRNYNAFKNLVDFFRKINIASPANYIKFMASNDISPVLWCRDQSYSLFLTYIDAQQKPLDSVLQTIEFVKKQANSVDISPNEFMNVMTLPEIAVLTQRRLLSPYFLIFSVEFRKILNDASNEERNSFVKSVPLQHWAGILTKDEALTDSIRNLVKEHKL